MKSRTKKRKPPLQVLLNLGCGPKGSGRVPESFSNWRQVRVDIESAVGPDVIADITDLSPIGDGEADAVWTAHCIEHLFVNQVRNALAEIYRVLAKDGFACIIVPDLQVVAGHIANDRLFEVLYESPAGPVTPHDVVFGFGAAIAAGRTSMAHRCGFTPSVLGQRLREAGFTDIVIRRRANWELVAVARKSAPSDGSELKVLLDRLAL